MKVMLSIRQDDDANCCFYLMCYTMYKQVLSDCFCDDCHEFCGARLFIYTLYLPLKINWSLFDIITTEVFLIIKLN